MVNSHTLKVIRSNSINSSLREKIYILFQLTYNCVNFLSIFLARFTVQSDLCFVLIIPSTTNTSWCIIARNSSAVKCLILPNPFLNNLRPEKHGIFSNRTSNSFIPSVLHHSFNSSHVYLTWYLYRPRSKWCIWSGKHAWYTFNYLINN